MPGAGAVTHGISPAHDLQRKGNFLYPAGRGREHGAHGGVLPLCRVQSLEWSGARQVPRRLQVLRHRLSWKDGENGGEYPTAMELAGRIAATWPQDLRGDVSPFVVCTGGEPLLQLDADLIRELHARGFEVAVETNGPRPAPPGLD